MTGIRFWILLIGVVGIQYVAFLQGECIRGGKSIHFRPFGTPGETSPWIRTIQCKTKAESPNPVHERLKSIFLNLKHGGPLFAMISGDRSLILDQTWKKWNRSGVGHILVISGQHLGIFAVMFLGIFRFIWRLFPFWSARFELNRWQGLITIPFIWKYVSWSGMNSSSIRAAVMISALLISKSIWVRMAKWQWLIISLLFITIVQPGAITDPSFHLSGAAVLGILVAIELMNVKAFWMQWYVVTLGATLGVLPVAAFLFGQISLFGWAASLISTPLMMVALPLLAVGSFLGEVGFKNLALIFLYPLDFAIELFERFVLNPISNHQSAMISLPLGGWPEFFLLISIIGGGGYLLVRRKWRWGILFILWGSLFLLSAPSLRGSLTKPPNTFQWTTLSVGQGESLLIQFPNEKTMLIDGGGYFSRSFDPGAQLVVPALRSFGVTHLDYVVVSHPDLDHLKGLFAVIEQIPVGEIWVNLGADSPPLLKEFIQMVQQKKIHLHQVDHQKKIIDGAEVLQLTGNNPSSSRNNGSIVLKIKYGEHSFLLTGDIEKGREKELLEEDVVLNANVLKVPHHGSKHSSTEAFLEVVNPQIAVVSTGFQNPYFHPHKSTQSRYRERKIPLLNTSVVGSVQIKTDGKNLSTHCFLTHWSEPCR